MNFIEWMWRLVSNVGFVMRKGHTHGRGPVLRVYLKIEIKRFFLAYLLGRKITSESMFGFRVQFYSYETFAILFEEVFIPDVYYFSSQESQPFVIDCGSNIGLAVFYFKSLYPGCKIIAFEPDDATFALLTRNVESNQLKDVTLVNKALCDSKGTIPFYFSPEQPGLLVQSIRKESLANSEEKTVETDVLSDHIHQQIDFLKMDIEGAENLVFRDLSQTTKLSFVSEMVIEYHHHITAKEDRLGEFLSLLEAEKFGYQVKATSQTPFKRGEFQGMLIYAYQRFSR
jgi:FkbM family methyltransferase